MSSHRSDTAEKTPARPETPGPLATIVLAAALGIAGAVAVVALHNTVADMVGVAAMAFGLAAALWAATRLAGDSDAAQ
jgi:ABC-type cobalamin transport system permease subunit